MTTPTNTEIARLFVTENATDTIYTRAAWHKYVNGVWGPVHDLYLAKQIWTLLERFENSGKIRPNDGYWRNVSRYAQATMFVPDDAIDQHPDLVNLRNGVFNLADGNLYPHDQSYYFTTQLPFDYDPHAIAPEWENYLSSTFVFDKSTQTDTELIAFMQEAIGYSLTIDISYHVMFWLLGEGSNGKGVLFSVLEALTGTASTALNLDLLRREKYQLANLAGKRIALCPESQATDNLVDDGTLKALVSGDTINVRQIRREPFDLHPVAKIWWAMNKIPAIADTSHGFWRRVKIVPFNRTFTNGDKIADLKSAF